MGTYTDIFSKMPCLIFSDQSNLKFLFSFESVSVDDSNTNKRNPSDTEAVTVGGTVGSSVIVVIGVILAFLAIRYA